MESRIEHNAQLPVAVEEGQLFSAQDLAVCSSSEARALLPYESAVKLGVLPISVTLDHERGRLHCAVVQDGPELRRAIQFLTDKEPVLTTVSQEILQGALARAYLGSGERVVSDIRRLSAPGIDSRGVAKTDIPKPQGDAAKFLSNVLEFAVARGASDLHLCPSPQGAFIKIRVDGDLLSYDQEHYPQGIPRARGVAS